MFVMCPLVHNYSVITLDNWRLAYCCPSQSKFSLIIIEKEYCMNIKMKNNQILY